MKFLIIFLSFYSFSVFAECKFLSHEKLGQEILAELRLEDVSCKNQEVHLTFDDGPSHLTTPAILKELKLRNIKSTFFITTTQLSNPKNVKLVQQEMAEGHLIASHGHHHHAHDLRMKDGKVLEEGYSKEQRKEEISKSIKLLDEATGGKFSKQQIQLGRFPFGRGASPSPDEIERMIKEGKFKPNSKSFAGQLKEYRLSNPALNNLWEHGLEHLGWNHDSKDSSFSDSVTDPDIIKSYIIQNLKSMCNSAAQSKIALFHDIKKMNTISIPVIADVGKCLGIKFISADQMMTKRSKLSSQGVLNSPEDQLKLVIGKLERGKFEPDPNRCDELEDVQEVIKPKATLNSKKPHCSALQCTSEYPRIAQDGSRSYCYDTCEGVDSKCLKGTWLSKDDPLIEAVCATEIKKP